MTQRPIQNFDVHFFRHRDGGWRARIAWSDANGEQRAWTGVVPSYAVIGSLAMIGDKLAQELLDGIRPTRVRDERCEVCGCPVDRWMQDHKPGCPNIPF